MDESKKSELIALYNRHALRHADALERMDSSDESVAFSGEMDFERTLSAMEAIAETLEILGYRVVQDDVCFPAEDITTAT